MEFKKLKLKNFVDSRGEVTVMEEDSLPFRVKRIFVIHHFSGVRGNHAHKELEQLLVCLRGSLSLSLINRDFSAQFKVENPEEAIYIPPMTWTDLFDIEKDTIVLVLASEKYEMADYIGDKTEFMKLIGRE